MSETGEQYTVAIMKQALKIDEAEDATAVAKAFDELLYQANYLARDAYARIMNTQTGGVQIALHDDHVKAMGGM